MHCFVFHSHEEVAIPGRSESFVQERGMDPKTSPLRRSLFFCFFKKKSAPVMRYYPGLVTLDKASCLASAGDYLPTYKVPNLGT